MERAYQSWHDRWFEVFPDRHAKHETQLFNFDRRVPLNDVHPPPFDISESSPQLYFSNRRMFAFPRFIFFSISLNSQYSQIHTIHKWTDFTISQTTETYNVHESARTTNSQYSRIGKHLKFATSVQITIRSFTNKANL